VGVFVESVGVEVEVEVEKERVVFVRSFVRGDGGDCGSGGFLSRSCSFFACVLAVWSFFVFLFAAESLERSPVTVSLSGVLTESAEQGKSEKEEAELSIGFFLFSKSSTAIELATSIFIVPFPLTAPSSWPRSPLREPRRPPRHAG